MTDSGCGGNCPCRADRATNDAVPSIAEPGLDRRTFLAQGAMATMAAALAACGLSSGFPTAPGSLSSPMTISVASYSALANIDGVAYLDANGSPLAVVRTGTSTFIALSRICPHAGSTVNTASGGFLCPGHGAEFDYSGRWIGGQRTSSLTSYPTQFDAATGMLTIG